jgi:dTDP-4-dehydrorhamnose reductase
VAGRLLITGGAGLLGRTAHEGFQAVGWDVVVTDIERLDIRDRGAVHEAVANLAPDAVLNVAAITDADLCEIEPDLAFATNATAVGHLAEACHRTGALLVQLSSDYVFDGAKRQPYTEADEPDPLSVYGRTKLDGERVAGPDALVVRTAWLSGHHGRSIVRTVLEQASSPGRVLRYVDDQRGSPTLASDLVSMLVPLVDERWTGTFHVTNQGEATWFDLARHVLVVAGRDPEAVRPISTVDLDPPRPAARPTFSVLDNAALRLAGRPLLRHWTDAVAELVTDLQRAEVT